MGRGLKELAEKSIVYKSETSDKSYSFNTAETVSYTHLEILGQQSFYIGMVFHELYFNVFLYIIKTSENERYLNEKCFFLKKSFFR